MLAGILFPICIAPVTASFEYPLLALPIVGSWFVFYRRARRWAVPAAMLAATIVIALSAETGWLHSATIAPQLTFVAPVFDPFVIVSLGLPLFIVTTAGQNVPGFVVMSTYGYTVPARVPLVTNGVFSRLEQSSAGTRSTWLRSPRPSWRARRPPRPPSSSPS